MAWLLAAAVPLPAIAQQAASVQSPQGRDYVRAVAAGYKAAFLCSGIFLAGRSEEQIERDELNGIYPEYQALARSLPATIDRRAGHVSVRWSETMPPRRAEWGPGKGCTTMPIGAAPGPAVTPPPVTGADPRQWPAGDRGIAPRPSPGLNAAVTTAFDRATYGRGSETVGVVVVHDGRIVAERYREGFGPFVANRTWSVAKSIAGMATGVAAAEGRVRAGDPVRIPEWGAWPRWDLRASITTDQLLRMSSGLYSDFPGKRTDAIYFGGSSVMEDATHWPLEAMPGTRFRYANNDILLAMHGLRARFADDRAWHAFLPGLFARLNMAHTVAERDWRGDYVLSSQVWTTARDLARFGQWMLQDGVWQGQRLLPAGWMAESIRPVGPQPPGREGYGRTLWLFWPDQGLPAGSYAAQGNRGQYVMVVPAHRLVIVRRGEDPNTRFDIARFTADVIRVLR